MRQDKRTVPLSHSNGNRYYNKHAGIRQFLADIGCPDNNITINESMEKVPGIDTIGARGFLWWWRR
ncbi:MAG: hypothetical protein K5886_09835 [Lachnospiraceae bacterium]|nr:hypothetical protein [Lachnospiraceae bacterium]